MKIAVIFTGGTIGSCEKNNFIGVDNKMQYVLLKKYENDNEIAFETSSPYSILSENLSADELNLLQKEIAEKLSRDFDGIIVTHGTDTLQYTSTAIEYAFCDSEIPIVFVSADYPLDNEKSNGYSNFKAAVEFIKNKIGKGVFISYKNNNESITKIHIPSHTLQHNESDANIYSIDETVFAEFEENFTFKSINLSNSVNSTGIIPFTADSQILVISAAPGQKYLYSLENVKSIILKSYHSGTLNTANEDFVIFCKSASEKHIPIFVSGVKSGTNYESTGLFTDLNIKPLPYSTFISAYIKIWIAVSLGYNIEEFIGKPIANEFIK